MSGVPDEMIPDDHVVLRGDGESYRGEIDICPRISGPGVVIEGVAPPEYAPAVFETGAGTYRVERMGDPTEHVDLREKACTCDASDADAWCAHLRWATLVAARGGEADE